MDVSCWSYYAPYHEELEEVLEALCQRVFDAGEYYQTRDYESSPTIDEVVQASLEDEVGTHSILDITRLVTQLQHYPDFVAVHMRMCNGVETLKRPFSSEEYTHYVQDDMYFFRAMVSPSSEEYAREEYSRYVQEYADLFGAALPFSSEDLIHHFRSEKPVRAEVEAAIKRGEIWSGIPLNVAFYAIVYQNDAPHEVVFIGVS